MDKVESSKYSERPRDLQDSRRDTTSRTPVERLRHAHGLPATDRVFPLQKHLFLTDTGNIVLLDLRVASGSSLGNVFEWNLLKQQGYVGTPGRDDMVQMIEAPNCKCNRLGYGFFGKEESGGHLHDPEAAETILQANYTPVQPSQEKVGDLIIYRDSQTNKIVGTGRVEGIEDGMVSEVSRKCNNVGGVYKHRPDIQPGEYSRTDIQPGEYSRKFPSGEWGVKQKNPPDTWEFYCRKNSSESACFKLTSANTPIEKIKDAKIIALGENHKLPEHVTWNARIIEILARPHDIVLIEGVQAYRPIKQEDCKYTKFIQKGIIAIGWDNMDLHNKARSMMENAPSLYNDEFHSTLDDIIFRQRNLSLANVLKNITQLFPDKKIFIIAGAAHFTVDPDLNHTLETYPYIALRPTYTKPPTDDEVRKHFQSQLQRLTDVLNR
jgi:hypothetical protein